MNKDLIKELELLRFYKEKGCLDTHYKVLIDYIDELEQKNKELHNKIDKLEDKITQMHKRFINGLCIDNYLGGRKTRKLFEEMYEILKDSDVDE